jgi:hypothetical protein
MKFTASLLVATLATAAYAQNHTVPDNINCGPDILVDDFSKSTKAPLPGETQIRDLNMLGGDYGKSDGASLSFVVNTDAKQVEITAGPNQPQNFFFAKFDAGACYDLTNIHAVAFDLTAPVGSTFQMTLTQKNADCVDRTPGNSDSEYIPIQKYVTPNGQKQTVVAQFADFRKNNNGSNFDFVHLKDWTLVGLQPVGAKFLISNIRLIRACNDNGPLGKNVTLTPNPPAAGGAAGGANGGAAGGASGGQQGTTDNKTSSSERLYGVAGLGLATLVAALAFI